MSALIATVDKLGNLQADRGIGVLTISLSNIDPCIAYQISIPYMIIRHNYAYIPNIDHSSVYMKLGLRKKAHIIMFVSVWTLENPQYGTYCISCRPVPVSKRARSN